VGAVANIDADRLRFDEGRDHVAEHRHHAIERAGEADPFSARPGEPGRGVPFPFSWHVIAESGGGLRFHWQMCNVQLPNIRDPVLNVQPSTGRRRISSANFWGQVCNPGSSGAAPSKCYGLAVGEGEIAGGVVDAGADAAPGEATGAGETCVVAGEDETAAAAVGAGDAWVLASSRRRAL